MKKFMIAFSLILLLCACSSNKNEKNNDKQVVCKLEENEESGVEVIYSYDKNKTITKIENNSYLQFTDDELQTHSLDEYYKQIKTQYEAAEYESGIDITLKKDEDKKRIIMNVVINIALYNMDDDILNITNDGEMDPINETVKLYEAMGIYHCSAVE